MLAVEVHQYSQWSSDVSFDAELSGVPTTAPTPPPPPMSGRPHVDSWMANYGPWNATSIALAQKHQLVVAHPRGGALTRALVAQIQQGVNPSDPSDDVKVLCYVSIGEDLRTGSVSDAQARVDARASPAIAPRPARRSARPQRRRQGVLGGIDPRGAASNGGSGFASYYLSTTIRSTATASAMDSPIAAPTRAQFFVNAGDPNWYPVIDAMTIDSSDGVSGFREAMTTGYGRGLGCDGVFLDTLDTAAPNSYTSCGSAKPRASVWNGPLPASPTSCGACARPIPAS